MNKKIFAFLITAVLCILAFAGLSVYAAETVNVSTVSALQSAHPYSNNMNKTWIYTHSKSVDGLKVTFSSNTETESNYDYIYILDGSDNQIGKYSGTALASKTITVPGNVVKIRLTSDGNVTKDGFIVTSISEIASSGGNSDSGTTPSSTGFASGSGTISSPYIINTPAQLLYFAEQLTAGYTFDGEYIKLNSDLDMTGYTWSVPSTAIFNGTFYGNNKTITINSCFLGKIDESGTIDWLNLKATQTLNSALMCKINFGTIKNCRVTGNVDASAVAGLLCENNNGMIYNCCGFGSIKGYGDDCNCFVGWVALNSGIIKNCYTKVTVSGRASGRYNSCYIGEISAKVGKGSIEGSIENCFSGDAVIANNEDFADKLNLLTAVPGYIWAVDSTNINNGYPVIRKCLDAKTELSYSSDIMFAYHTSSITTRITSNVSGCTIYYTLDGTNPSTSSTRKTYSSSLTFSDDFKIRTVAYKDGLYSVPTLQYGIKLYGSGTASNPYKIKSNLGLYAIRFLPDKAYSLETDLDFTDYEYINNGSNTEGWTPIPNFTGTLDGKSHSITGISGTYGGLFNSTSGTIQNLRLINHKLCNKNDAQFGSIANTNSGAIIRCYSSIADDAPASYNALNVGGIVGDNSGTVSYCQTTGNLRTTAASRYPLVSMGGIAGTGGIIKSCYSDMTITTPYSSHDLGATAAGMGGNASYSYDCRYDGCINFQSFDAFTSIGSARFPYNESTYTVRCYDGGFTLMRPGTDSGINHINDGIDCYKYTNSYQDYFELNCPSFDFDTVWMITPDGPMPQGIMNSDGYYYTKKSYTAPTCTTDGSTVCLNQNNQITAFKLEAYGHDLKEGYCTRCSYKEIFNIEIKNTVVDGFDEIYKDCSYLLEAVISPIDAIDKTITWTSSDNSIATVSQNGLLSCLNCGTVKITAAANNGVNTEIEINIVETPYLNDIGVLGTQSAAVGSSNINHRIVLSTNKNANAIYCFVKYPDTLSLKSVTAKDFSYANLEDEYTENGFTTAVILAQYSETELMPKNKVLTPFELSFDISKSAAPGTVRIEATEESCLIGNDTYFFEERISGELEILPKLVETIEITGEDTISSASQYAANVTPDYATNKEVIWSIDKTEIASIDENGIVTPVTSGTVVITAAAADGSNVSAAKTVEIVKFAESIEIVGEEEISKPTQYNAVVLPDYTTNKNVKWHISDSSVATVDENGLITPLKNGKILLTATAEDASGITAAKSIVVTVNIRANSITSDIGVWDKEFDSDVTEYTVYVTTDTAAVCLTSRFTDATAKINGTIAANGIGKKINLAEKETPVEIVLTPVSGNELKSNIYSINIVKFDGTKTTVSEDGKTFIVKSVNVEMGNTVVLALYDNGKFVDMQSAEFDGTDITFTTDKAYTNAKVMVWSDLASLKPICSAEAVK